MIGYHYYKDVVRLESKYPTLKFNELEQYFYSLTIGEVEFIICEIPTNLCVIANLTKSWQFSGIKKFEYQHFKTENFYIKADSYIKDKSKTVYKIFYFPLINKNYFSSVDGVGDNHIFYKAKAITKFIESKLV